MSGIVLDRGSQASLWEHMFKKCVVRLGCGNDYHRREDLLAEIEAEVLDGAYSPSAIHGFLSCAKGQGVPRFVPVPAYRDLAVYFGCVRAFDETLADLAVEDTYGGWSLGGKRREFEEQQAKEMFDSAISTPLSQEELDELGLGDILDTSVPVSSYNRWAWVENWSQYWKLLAARFEHAPDDACFACFDIANFYDTIDLPRLERLIRACCSDGGLAIEVLFHYLRNWNRHLNQYAPTTKGIPMDIVGDCSRVLANFYLTPYDRAIREKAVDKSCDYMRFADDMVIACPSHETCRNMVYESALELHRLGLNINVAKVRYLRKSEFERWWGFSILDDLQVPENVERGLTELQARFDDRGFGRRETALKRAITVLGKRPDLSVWRKWVSEQALSSEEFVLSLADNQMKSLLLISEGIPDALNDLSIVVLAAPFTQPKACLLRCLEGFRCHEDVRVKEAARTVYEEIAAIDDPVLKLAIANIPADRRPCTPARASKRGGTQDRKVQRERQESGTEKR